MHDDISSPPPEPSRDAFSSPDPSAPHLLAALKSHARPEQICGIIERPARMATLSPWPEWVPASLLEALAEQGTPQAWAHQAQAAECIRAGRHTVVATGTGSGKSLAAWVPMLSTLVESRSGSVSLARVTYKPTALYLSPTKALAADQMTALSTLAKAVDPRIAVATADGDSDLPSRSWAREHADIILTNPDFAHHVMLAGQQRWARLWRGLTMIVVDEFHNYKGMFGAHVAHVVRRILRVAAFYGAHPTVVFLSATSGDPAGSAAQFLGDAFGPVSAVTEDASPRGAQQIVLWQCRNIEDPKDDDVAEPPNACSPGLRWDVPAGEWPAESVPPVSTKSSGPAKTVLQQPSEFDEEEQLENAVLDEDTPRRAANTEAGELTGLLAAAGARTLTFVRSRPGTESVAEIAREYLGEHSPELAHRVAAYRGGYLPEERRELEQRLREGDLLALATTNALELGIDISGLDAVVVTGWPGTHASFAQQIGRAGRAGRSGLAIFVGRENPLDQYLLDHPNVIEETPTEAGVFDPSNPHVLIPQVCSAAAELPLQGADAAIFGLPDTGLFEDLSEQGLLRHRPTGWFWNTTLGLAAHQTVSLRGESSTVSIVDAEAGVILGTVDSAKADTSVYPGAIYLHQGVPYRVDELTDEVALVHLHRDEEIRTYAREELEVEILTVHDQVDIGPGIWARGSIAVHSRVIGYDIRRTGDGLYLGMVPLSMPVRRLDTSATWWTLKRQTLLDAGLDPSEIPGALHAAEHASIGLLPLFAICDRWDLGGLSTAAHAQTGVPTVFVHDAVQGGSGCASRGFESGATWVATTLRTIESCTCRSGCPRCIQSPKCGNNNEPLSKAGAIIILRLLLEAMEVHQLGQR